MAGVSRGPLAAGLGPAPEGLFREGCGGRAVCISLGAASVRDTRRRRRDRAHGPRENGGSERQSMQCRGTAGDGMPSPDRVEQRRAARCRADGLSPLINYQRCQRMRTTHAGLASRLPSISRPSTRDAVLGDSISDDWDRPGSYGDVNPGTDGLTARTNSVPRRPAMTNDMCSCPVSTKSVP